MQQRFILSIDQGTTSSRAMVFNDKGRIVTVSQHEFPQIYPQNGWVEHRPEDIWQTSFKACREVLADMDKQGQTIDTIGITNQRETTIIWNRETAEPVYNAIVWQDRRTADKCNSLKTQGLESVITSKTGLLLDPYFSATKIAWILDNVEGAREHAERGQLAFGTVDSFLLWKLTAGKIHATDATNASRTMLYNIKESCWDEELLSLFDIPHSILPIVKDSADDYGVLDDQLFGVSIPINSMVGDQQAATIGQGCFASGDVKSTYGTGCFVMLNTGKTPIVSKNRLLTTIAYSLDGKSTYALEGAVFIAGAAVQWLRDELSMISHARESEALAASLSDNQGVYLVPAFTGLGAPYWNPDVRGALFGLTRNTGIAQITRATLESIVYQSADLLQAMQRDGATVQTLRVDGGMAVNDWLMQYLADILDCDVVKPVITETTALGAALFAGLYRGIFDSLDDISARLQEHKRYIPAMPVDKRKEALLGWNQAVAMLIQKD